MKNKFLIVILVFFILLLIFIINIKSSDKNNSENEVNTNNTNTIKINNNGENSGDYVGMDDNFIFISIKINKNTSKENQVKSLITEISNSMGYKIDINSIEINENKIKIDFAKTSAPFELQESYNETDLQKYSVSSESIVPKTIFESINKTLKSYFGNETEVYFSADSENINIQNEALTINLDKNVAY